MSKIKSFNLWMEGYACTGNTSTAKFLGVFEADTFEHACDKWATTIEDKKYYQRNGNIASFWGCRIYDNEAAARRSFG